LVLWLGCRIVDRSVRERVLLVENFCPLWREGSSDGKEKKVIDASRWLYVFHG